MRKGFTVIELIVCIALIALLSGVGYQGYSAFEASQKDRKIVSNIDRLIRSLDREVANDSISSYVMTFSSGALGAVVTTNTYRLAAPLKLASFDWATLSGALDMSSMPGNPGFRTMVDGKIAGTTMGSGGLASIGFSFPLGVHDSLGLVGFEGATALNNFRFELFEPEAVLSPVESRPTLRFQDASLDGVTLKNFRSKKTLESSSGAALSSAALVFERLGRVVNYVISTND